MGANSGKLTHELNSLADCWPGFSRLPPTNTWVNQTQPLSNPLCVHQLFEAQVERTPNGIAVVFEDAHLTYRQLNQRANQLAHFLQAQGVGPDVLVGVYMTRSLALVITLLAILKAGGAYVPLDPAYPSERLTFILDDTQVNLILTQTQFVNNLPSQGKTIVCVDADWPQIATNSIANLNSGATADNLMYVIYTSGSTGNPKGVMISHAGIHNQLYWRNTTFPLTARDRVLQTIPVSFDPSVWQIFWPLSAGAQLVLAKPDGHRDSAYLVDTIAQQQITVIALVPSLLRVLLEERDLHRCRCLRYVFCGGEALPLDLQERFFDRFNVDNVLHNVYGPTEASIDATVWVCQRGSTHNIAPIGKPITNTQVYLLDAEQQPVPIGTPGELHIGGAGLARGYLNRPDLTAAKFIPNPFNPNPGSRLYKTGDLARYLPNGDIEFLGRIDYQVKIRGFRIELEEIEAALGQHPLVCEVVVAAHEARPGDKRLIAYVVPAPECSLNAAELRRFLQERLPDYMVPATFVPLAQLPLSPNGKVDRRALPAPEPERLTLDGFVAPQDSLERDLAAIWAQTLQVEPIGVTDNFFDLGGNSLLAAGLLTQVEAKFGRKLPLSTLFEAPTIADLVSILRIEPDDTIVKALVPIQPQGTKPPLFCLHPRTGNVFLYYDLARYLNSDQPVYGLQMPLMEGESIPSVRIELLAATYVAEMRSLQPEGPYFLCGYSFGGLIAYEIAQQLQAQGQTVALLALLDTYNTPVKWFKPLSLSQRFANWIKLSWRRLQIRPDRAQGKSAHTTQPPNATRADLLNPSNPVHAACEQAARDYKPRAYRGSVVLLRAHQSPRLYGVQPTIADAQAGWGPLVLGRLDVQMLPCNHFNMLFNPQVQAVATALQSQLTITQRSHTAPSPVREG